MFRIKCLITDDEPFALKGLKGYVEKIDFLQLEGTCENALELNELLLSQEVDLLFLDIQMPHLSGIDFLKSLKKPDLMVIFTTAHPEHALEGYELDVLDYLLKPISFARFLQAANKAKALYELKNQNTATKDYFFIKTDKRLEKIKLEEILFVEAKQNYVMIHTANSRLMAHLTLKSLKEYLPDNQFIQPHRSFIVAMDKISAIEGNQIMIGQQAVPISKYQKEEVLSQIVNFQLGRG